MKQSRYWVQIFLFSCCLSSSFFSQSSLISIKTRTELSDFWNHSIAGWGSITLSPLDTNLSKPGRCLETKGQFFSARDDIPCPAQWPNVASNEIIFDTALALLSRLGDQLRLTLTRASLLSPDPTWHTSFTDASENEPIQAIFSMAAVPAGLISSLDITNAVNWSIGVQWRFVLVLRPSLTAVGVLVEFSCCKRAGGARKLKLEVPSGTMRRSFDHCYQVLKKWMSTSSPDLSCLCNLSDSVC